MSPSSFLHPTPLAPVLCHAAAPDAAHVEVLALEAAQQPGARSDSAAQHSQAVALVAADLSVLTGRQPQLQREPRLAWEVVKVTHLYPRAQQVSRSKDFPHTS